MTHRSMAALPAALLLAAAAYSSDSTPTTSATGDRRGEEHADDRAAAAGDSITGARIDADIAGVSEVGLEGSRRFLFELVVQ